MPDTTDWRRLLNDLVQPALHLLPYTTLLREPAFDEVLTEENRIYRKALMRAARELAIDNG